MLLKLPDSRKLLISYSLSQYCGVLGHAIITKPCGRRVPSAELLTWLFLSLAAQVLQGTEELGRKESSPGDREGLLPLAAHTWTAHSAPWKLLLGHSSTQGISHSRQGSWPALVPPVCTHVTLQKDAADKWFNRKKQKPTKPPPGTLTAGWSTTQMLHEENVGKGLQGSAFRAWIDSLTLLLVLPCPLLLQRQFSTRGGSAEPDPGWSKKKNPNKSAI